MSENKLKIIKYPNPILRKECVPIKDIEEPEIQALVENMLVTMKENNGMGLAAPQVGKNLQLCVAQVEDKTFILINPKITSKSKKTVIIEEGCLSLPGQYYFIERPIKVSIKALDRKGEKIRIKAKGMTARTLQHEIDHLQGELIIDKKPETKNG